MLDTSTLSGFCSSELCMRIVWLLKVRSGGDRSFWGCSGWAYYSEVLSSSEPLFGSSKIDFCPDVVNLIGAFVSGAGCYLIILLSLLDLIVALDSETDFCFFVPESLLACMCWLCYFSVKLTGVTQVASLAPLFAPISLVICALLTFWPRFRFTRARVLPTCDTCYEEWLLIAPLLAPNLGLCFFARDAAATIAFDFRDKLLECESLAWCNKLSSWWLCVVDEGIMVWPLLSRPWVLNSRTRGFCTISPVMPSLKLVPIDPMDIMPEDSPLWRLEPTLELDPLKFAGGVWTPPLALYSWRIKFKFALDWAGGWPCDSDAGLCILIDCYCPLEAAPPCGCLRGLPLLPILVP